MAGGFTVLGIAYATSSASAADQPGTTSGASGLVSGNQTGSRITAPVKVAANQVTIAGNGNRSTSQGGDGTAGGSDSGSQSTSGANGIGSGNQTGAAATAPVNASGNQVTVLGDGNQSSSSQSDGGNRARSGGDTTSGDSGTGSGNQTAADVTAPVGISGNQVTVLGDGNAVSAQRSDAAEPSGSGSQQTDGTNGTGSGNQTDLGVAAPVDASGNQVTVLGDGNTNTAEAGNNPAARADQNGGTTTGTNGTGSGNQTDLGVAAPVDASGNQVTVLGDGNTNARESDNGAATDDQSGGTTNGENGTGSGNQTNPGVAAPVDASGNQVTVIGDGNTATDEGPGSDEDPSTGDDTSPETDTDPSDDAVSGSAQPASSSTSGGVTSPAGEGSGLATGAAQGGPAYSAGVLPQTGASAMLLLFLLLGLATLFGGLYMVGIDRASTRRRKEVSRSSNHI